MKSPRKTTEEGAVESILEASIVTQKQGTDEINQNLEHLIMQGERNNPEGILEAQTVVQKKILDEVSKPMELKITINDAETVSYKGEKGDAPTNEELLDLIKPLIPEPIKGEDDKSVDEEEVIGGLLKHLLPKIPTVEEVAKLVPPGAKGEKGRDADEERIIADLTSRIPKPVPGPMGPPGKDGSPDTGLETLKKLKALPKGSRLPYEWIDGAPEFNHHASKTVSLTELDDVDYSGLEFVNGKYVLGSGGGGVVWSTAPTDPTDDAEAGEIAYDADYFYVAIAADTWKRTALSTWVAAGDFILTETGDELLTETGDNIIQE